jgi:hypothetical protein
MSHRDRYVGYALACHGERIAPWTGFTFERRFTDTILPGGGAWWNFWQSTVRKDKLIELQRCDSPAPRPS